MNPHGESLSSAAQKELHLKEEVLQAFFRLLQTTRIHRENNRLLIGCAENLVQTIVEFNAREDHILLRFRQRRLYVQSAKMVYRPENEGLINNLLAYFEARQMQGIRIYNNIKSASVAEVVRFGRLLNRCVDHPLPHVWLKHQFAEEKLNWAEPLFRNAKGENIRRDRQQKAQKTYANVLRSVQDMAEKLTNQRRTGISEVLRMAQGMVDLMMEDEPLFAMLSTIRIHDDYTYAHSVNVAILSMCLGRRIVLSRRSLERLGICALLHDLGKVMVPHDILQKPGRLTPEEFEEIKKHSLNSARMIARIRASRERKARILIPPLEHHMKYDLSGYPDIRRKKPLSLFGRILTIADVYDAITSPRIYRRSYLSPDRALGLMLEGAGKDFDPVLVKVFINMMGIYPIGTLLKLDTGELGLVSESFGNADGRRPRVIILEPDGDGGGFARGDEADLRERTADGKGFKRNIVRSFHPNHFGIQPAEFLLS